MRDCNCEKPNPGFITPNRPHGGERCIKCSGYINPDWTSNDATVKEFFDRLEESLFPLGVLRAPLPSARLQEFREFRLQAEMRELAGRRKFGFEYLRRDNPREATEEFTDGSNYFLFDVLTRRRNGQPEDIELALEGAAAAFRAWQFAYAKRRHKHRAFSEGVAV